MLQVLTSVAVTLAEAREPALAEDEARSLLDALRVDHVVSSGPVSDSALDRAAGLGGPRP